MNLPFLIFLDSFDSFLPLTEYFCSYFNLILTTMSQWSFHQTVQVIYSQAFVSYCHQWIFFEWNPFKRKNYKILQCMNDIPFHHSSSKIYILTLLILIFGIIFWMLVFCWWYCPLKSLCKAHNNYQFFPIIQKFFVEFDIHQGLLKRYLKRPTVSPSASLIKPVLYYN